MGQRNIKTGGHFDFQTWGPAPPFTAATLYSLSFLFNTFLLSCFNPKPPADQDSFLFFLLLFFIFYRARKSLWKNITKRETCSKHLCKVTEQTLHSKWSNQIVIFSQQQLKNTDLFVTYVQKLYFFPDQTATTAAFTLISSVRLLLYLPLWFSIKRQLAEAASRYCHT